MVTTTATPENGTNVIPNAYYIYTTASDEDVPFPASAYRYDVSGELAEVGRIGFYWTSSVSDASKSYLLYLFDAARPDDADCRAWGQSVRCVLN
jgi:hypothetical protein